MKNRYFVSGDVAVIEIYQSIVKRFYYTMIDKDDLQYVLVNVKYINLKPENWTDYASCSLKNGKQTSLHRFLMNTPNHLQVDHLNYNGLDNRRINLRNCTVRENVLNKRKRIPDRECYFKLRHKVFLAELSEIRRKKVESYYS